MRHSGMYEYERISTNISRGNGIFRFTGYLQGKRSRGQLDMEVGAILCDCESDDFVAFYSFVYSVSVNYQSCISMNGIKYEGIRLTCPYWDYRYLACRRRLSVRLLLKALRHQGTNHYLIWKQRVNSYDTIGPIITKFGNTGLLHLCKSQPSTGY